MKVIVTTKTGDPRKIDVVDKVIAANDAFPYWAFWYPEDTDGEVRVVFINRDEVIEVALVGKEEEPKLASVTSLRGGDNIGPV